MSEYIVRHCVTSSLRKAPHSDLVRMARLAETRLLVAGWNANRWRAIIYSTAPYRVVLHIINGVDFGFRTERWAKKRFYVGAAMADLRQGEAFLKALELGHKVRFTRVPFTPEEDATIRQMVSDGLTYKEIGTRLERNLQSIWARGYQVLGIRRRRLSPRKMP